MKPCKLFAGRISPRGYGVGPKKVPAHRLAYVAAHGLALADIAGQFVRHTCDVRACCEPSHLVLGSHKDNMRDMRERGRSNRGERHGSAKINAEDVAAIRDRYVPFSRQHGAAAIARDYGLHPESVCRILRGERWQTGTDSLSH